MPIQVSAHMVAGFALPCVVHHSHWHTLFTALMLHVPGEDRTHGNPISKPNCIELSLPGETHVNEQAGIAETNERLKCSSQLNEKFEWHLKMQCNEIRLFI